MHRSISDTTDANDATDTLTLLRLSVDPWRSTKFFFSFYCNKYSNNIYWNLSEIIKKNDSVNYAFFISISEKYIYIVKMIRKYFRLRYDICPEISIVLDVAIISGRKSIRGTAFDRPIRIKKSLFLLFWLVNQTYTIPNRFWNATLKSIVRLLFYSTLFNSRKTVPEFGHSLQLHVL